MITFLKLEKKGNIGNQLFQIASTIGVALANNHTYAFPSWTYAKFFKNSLPIVNIDEHQELIKYNEEKFEFHTIKFNDLKATYDLEGWFQSELYFNKEEVKKVFEFKPSLIEKVKNQFKDVLLKKTILLSIRRGDFVNHPDYFQLPIDYYMNALIDNFNDWSDCNLIFLSDDIDYCQFHFSFLENAYFAKDISVIEQLVLASICHHFIISNSTFSWWCAWLGEKSDSKIIRPIKNFTDSKNKIDNDKDFFPKRWKKYNHINKKITLINTNLVLKKQNAFIEAYLNNYFKFSNVVYLKNLDNTANDLINYNNLHIPNNYLLPPFSIYVAFVNANLQAKNSIFYLKGKLTKISNIFDFPILKQQFDFGIFSKIFKNQKENKSRKILFMFFVLGKLEIYNKTVNFKTNTKIDFNKNYCNSGVLKGLFALKYTLITGMFKLIKRLKSIIKKIIR